MLLCSTTQLPTEHASAGNGPGEHFQPFQKLMLSSNWQVGTFAVQGTLSIIPNHDAGHCRYVVQSLYDTTCATIHFHPEMRCSCEERHWTAEEIDKFESERKFFNR